MTERADGDHWGLATMPLFAGCSEEELAPLVALLHEQRLATGDVLIHQGDVGDFFALLVRGGASIVDESGDRPVTVAHAVAGSVVGEFSLLRGRPRVATVTATEPSLAVVGGAEAFATLLDVPGVHDRIEEIVSARLAEGAAPVRTELTDGTPVLLRPLLHTDRPLLSKAIDAFSPESLRSRFFAAGRPSERLIDYLVNINYVDHFSWVVAATDQPDEGLAIARYIRLQDHSERAEVAFGVADVHHGRGLGTLLLGALGAAASATDITTFTANVLDDNYAMRSVLKKAGAAFRMREPGVVVTTFPVADAAGLLDEDLRGRLRQSSRDIVTAAGLALAHPPGAPTRP